MPRKGETSYDEAIFTEICEHVSAGGTLKAICREKKEQGIKWPSDFAVRLWVVNDVKSCASRYARARESQAEAWADQILEVADNKDRDTITNERGDEVCDHEWLGRSRLKVDTRKWLMAKLHPRQYGEKVEQTVKGEMTHKADDSVTALLAAIRSDRKP